MSDDDGEKARRPVKFSKGINVRLTAAQHEKVKRIAKHRYSNINVSDAIRRIIDDALEPMEIAH